MNKWVFLNDDFILEQDACLHFRDLSVQRGYGIFDFFKTANETPLFLTEHLDRFFSSAQQMHLPVEKTREELRQIIHELIKRNQIPDSGIRITLTGGYSADGYELANPNLIIAQQPLQTPSEEAFRKGIKLVSYEHQRQMSQVKSIDYLMAIWLQAYIKQHGANDVLYHQNGFVTECPRANFFIVSAAGKIVTPKQNMLKGITRNKLIKIAASKFEIEERNPELNEIRLAKEAFITSTTKNILPVLALDGKTIGNGMPGPITQQLSELLKAHLQPNVPQHQ